MSTDHATKPAHDTDSSPCVTGYPSALAGMGVAIRSARVNRRFEPTVAA